MDKEPRYYTETIATWNKVAELYNKKFMHLDLYDETYDSFCAYLEPGASVLEIGCGPGNITQYILSKCPDLKMTASDVSPKMAELAKINNPSAHCVVMDARGISGTGKSFDAVVCGFCLPYLAKKDVEKLVEDAHSLLNENGIIYLSTIEGDYESSKYEAGSSGDKMFIHYYEASWLGQLLALNNFEQLNFYRIKYPKKDASIDTHLVFIARRK